MHFPGVSTAVPVMSRGETVVWGLLTGALAASLITFAWYWLRLSDWHDHRLAMGTVTVVLALTVVQFVQAWLGSHEALPRRPTPTTPRR